MMISLDVLIPTLLGSIQPTAASEHARRLVFGFVARVLCGLHPGTEVVWFGSVPLKTYLPDGDVDVCAFPPSTVKEGNIDQWFVQVKTVMEKLANEGEDAEYPISNVMCINADVKILKALVGNILVDISVNKMGGIAALCFLEEVDRFIARNHLFKRSILLIKCWCCMKVIFWARTMVC